MYTRFLRFFILLMAFASVGIHAKPVNKTFWKDLAIKGVDPVAYFTEGKAVEGKKAHELEWNNATWRFASEANLKAFKADPERYAPQYGGYCAWAMSKGDTADIDPKQWTIHDGKLYLNYNRDIQEKWLKQRDSFIQKADKHWSEDYKATD